MVVKQRVTDGTTATRRSLTTVNDPTPAGTAPGHADQGQVDLARPYASGQRRGTALRQRDLHPAVRLVEGGQRVEQRGHGAAGHHAHREQAAQQPGHVVGGLPGRATAASAATRVLEHGLTRAGERGTPGRPVDELDAKLVFELPDLGADPGLADSHPLGRAGEVRFLGDRDEVLQLDAIP